VVVGGIVVSVGFVVPPRVPFVGVIVVEVEVAPQKGGGVVQPIVVDGIVVSVGVVVLPTVPLGGRVVVATVLFVGMVVVGMVVVPQ
jgi:hypothetical protein